MTATTTFDPSRYLTKIGNADYLEVKWRLVWLREVQPNASIETELVSHDEAVAVFRAKVSLPDGGSATGWGSESRGDFRDYIEKAETKAIGRALAALGFGTQFCSDFEFGAAAGRVVDSPIDFASTKGRRAVAENGESDRRIANLNQPATQRQLKFISAIAREAGLDEAAIDEEAERIYGASVAHLGRREASALIERLQARRGAADLAS